MPAIPEDQCPNYVCARAAFHSIISHLSENVSILTKAVRNNDPWFARQSLGKAAELKLAAERRRIDGNTVYDAVVHFFDQAEFLRSQGAPGDYPDEFLKTIANAFQKIKAFDQLAERTISIRVAEQAQKAQRAVVNSFEFAVSFIKFHLDDFDVDPLMRAFNMPGLASFTAPHCIYGVHMAAPVASIKVWKAAIAFVERADRRIFERCLTDGLPAHPCEKPARAMKTSSTPPEPASSVDAVEEIYAAAPTAPHVAEAMSATTGRNSAGPVLAAGASVELLAPEHTATGTPIIKIGDYESRLSLSQYLAMKILFDANGVVVTTGELIRSGDNQGYPKTVKNVLQERVELAAVLKIPEGKHSRGFRLIRRVPQQNNR